MVQKPHHSTQSTNIICVEISENLWSSIDNVSKIAQQGFIFAEQVQHNSKQWNQMVKPINQENAEDGVQKFLNLYHNAEKTGTLVWDQKKKLSYTYPSGATLWIADIPLESETSIMHSLIFDKLPQVKNPVSSHLYVI